MRLGLIFIILGTLGSNVSLALSCGGFLEFEPQILEPLARTPEIEPSPFINSVEFLDVIDQVHKAGRISSFTPMRVLTVIGESGYETPLASIKAILEGGSGPTPEFLKGDILILKVSTHEIDGVVLRGRVLEVTEESVTIDVEAAREYTQVYTMDAVKEVGPGHRMVRGPQMIRFDKVKRWVRIHPMNVGEKDTVSKILKAFELPDSLDKYI